MSLPSPSPEVVVFVERWTAADCATHHEAIRAHLRGLGAVLVVRSRAAAWRFRADDDLEVLASEAAQTGDVELHCDTPDEVLITLAAASRALAAARPRITVPMTRREWVLTNLAASAVVALASCRPAVRPSSQTVSQTPVPASDEIDVVLNVNGADRGLRIDPRVSLLDALRERLALPGTKKGCDHGQCGACTVLVDGRRVNSCLTLAITLPGKKIQTIEGLADGDTLHPMQAAFLSCDGMQCGYCTPGQIMSAVGLVAEGRAHTDDEVREAMSGNLCRCGAYPNIVAAVQKGRA